MTDIRRRMSRTHEADVAVQMGGWGTPGSGNQASKPMDGRTDRRRVNMGFAWDCKATCAASIGVSLAMIDKAEYQAHGERWLLPLRFYADYGLRAYRDVAVLDWNDFVEMLEIVNAS